MIRRLSSFAVLAALLLAASLVWGVPEEEGEGNGGASYIGQKKCKKCHMKQHRTWKKMKQANAWNTLPEKYRDGQQKDDSGRVCVSCHTTGYGKGDKGGFVDTETSKHLLGVQCEACHGPGSNHKVAGDKVLKDKSRKEKKFKAGEKSFINPKPTGCTGCHNPHVSHTKYKPK